MKLKTQLVSYCLTTIPPKSEKRAEGTREELSHDALVAHALMQAMGDCPSLILECKAITERADVLMQEWTR